MTEYVGPFGVVNLPGDGKEYVGPFGVMTDITTAVATEVFFEHKIDAISFGEKFQTAAQLNGVLVE